MGDGKERDRLDIKAPMNRSNESDYFHSNMPVPTCQCSYCVPWPRVGDNSFLKYDPRVTRAYHQAGIPVAGHHSGWNTGPRIAWLPRNSIPGLSIHEGQPPTQSAYSSSSSSSLKNQNNPFHHQDLKPGFWQIPRHTNVTQGSGDVTSARGHVTPARGDVTPVSANTTLVHSNPMGGIPSVRESTSIVKQRRQLLVTPLSSRKHVMPQRQHQLELLHQMRSDEMILASKKLRVAENNLQEHPSVTQSSTKGHHELADVGVTHSSQNASELLLRARLLEEHRIHRTSDEQNTSKHYVTRLYNSEEQLCLRDKEVLAWYEHVTQYQSTSPFKRASVIHSTKDLASSSTATVTHNNDSHATAMYGRDSPVTHITSPIPRHMTSPVTLRSVTKYGRRHLDGEVNHCKGLVTQFNDRDKRVTQEFGGVSSVTLSRRSSPTDPVVGHNNEPHVTLGNKQLRVQSEAKKEAVPSVTQIICAPEESWKSSLRLFIEGGNKRAIVKVDGSIEVNASSKRHRGRGLTAAQDGHVNPSDVTPCKDAHEKAVTLSRNDEGTGTPRRHGQGRAIPPLYRDQKRTDTQSYPNHEGSVTPSCHERETTVTQSYYDQQRAAGKIIVTQPNEDALLVATNKDSMITLPKSCPQEEKLHDKLAVTQSIKQPTGALPVATCTCSFCGKSFGNTRALELHVRRHSGLRPYACKFCDKSFYQPSERAVHMRTHTGARPYRCPHCLKLFRYSGDLKQHINIHTGQRPYQCEICAKAFTNHSTLRQHRRIHTGERPYKCTVCNRTYRYHSSLKQHLAAHANKQKGKVVKGAASGTKADIQLDSLGQ